MNVFSVETSNNNSSNSIAGLVNNEIGNNGNLATNTSRKSDPHSNSARTCSARRLFLSLVVLIVFVVVVFTVLMGYTAYTFMSKTNTNKENFDRRDKSTLKSTKQLDDLNEKFERNAMNWFKETLRQSFFQFSNNFNQYEQDYYKNEFENDSGNLNRSS
jgi:hypothetical protein